MNVADSELGLLRDKLRTCEVSIMSSDGEGGGGGVSEELFKRMSHLETMLVEKDRTIFGFESKVPGFFI